MLYVSVEGVAATNDTEEAPKNEDGPVGFDVDTDVPAYIIPLSAIMGDQGMAKLSYE